MRTLFLDLETYCETPIKDGLHKYAEAVEITLYARAWNDGPVEVIEFPSAAQVQADIDDADVIVIHNAAFDRTVLRHALGVVVPLAKTHCTMARALAHGLPGSLGLLCDVMGVAIDKAKDKAGSALVMLFCKPRPKNVKIRRATSATHPAEWARFIDYAALDVEAMRALYTKLPKWNYDHTAQTNQGMTEHQLWQLDQTINERGFAVDVELAQAALKAVDIAQAGLKARTLDITNGEVEAATQRDAMLAHVLSEYGVELPNMQAGTLERRIEDPDLPEPLRELLRIRLMATTSSTAKYKSLLKGVSADSRLRGTLQFCGAGRTGRWSGRLFQPQNLPRPNLDGEAIAQGIEAIKADCVDLLHGNVMEMISNAIRGCIVAAPGHKLCIADLSNIEGRVLAWGAGETWKLKAFADFDAGVGHDLYKLGAGRIIGKDPALVTKDERQTLGKVPELALGYQGAVGAFGTMAKLYGLDLPEQEILRIVKAWRRANPNIVKFWYATEEAAVAAVLSPGVTIAVGDHAAFRKDGAWLKMILPSGRALSYASPKVENGKLSYMGVNGYTRKWERIRTYGGKLVENWTQATARDVLAYGMGLVEQAGYAIVLDVHDELLTETLDSPVYSSDHLSALMSTNPPWAQGLPLAAAGFETHRYRKQD